VSTASLLYILAILFIGMPAALRITGLRVRVRNPVALVMVGSWLFCRALYEATGEGMPLEGMIVSDMAVIAAMFMKDDWETVAYCDLRCQLAALWRERTPWDRAILAIFPLAWALYLPLLQPVPQFWALWTLSMAQLALAGIEPLSQWLRVNGQTSRADAPGEPPGLMFAPVLGRKNA
jgi:hypothetical protein